jgi:hypothetical protein
MAGCSLRQSERRNRRRAGRIDFEKCKTSKNNGGRAEESGDRCATKELRTMTYLLSSGTPERH